MLEQALQSFLEVGLVGLDRQEVMASLLIKDLLGGLHLRVHGIGQHDLAAQLQAPQQLAGGRNLIALGRRDDPAQILSLAAGRIDHFDAAMAHFLAIDNDQRVLDGTGQPALPI